MTFQQDHRDVADSSKKLLKRSKQEAVTIASLGAQGAITTSSIQSEVGDTFDEFKKPEWDVARGGSADSHPVSYTKGTNAVVDVVIEFTITPGGQSAALSKISGVSPYFLSFEKTLNQPVGTGRVTIAGLVARDPLPNYVWWEDEDIDWSVVADGQSLSIGTTGTHRVYVTFDTPTGKMASTVNNLFTETGADQIVTEKRLAYSVNAAMTKGKNNEKECVDAIFKTMSNNVGYVLYRRWEPGAVNNTGVLPKPTLHHYLWLCITASGQGECHNIAAAFALACRIIGVRGSFEVGYMYPWPSRVESPPNYPKSSQKSPAGQNILGKYNVQYRRQHAGESHGTEHLMFLDGAGGRNNFEGVVCYQGNALYAIGDDVFDAFPDPNDNASSYYSLRDLTPGALRRAITNRNTGCVQLFFVDSSTWNVCNKPYPWVAGRRLSSNPQSATYAMILPWFWWQE